MSTLCLEAADRFAVTFAQSGPEDSVPGDRVARVTIVGAARMCAVTVATVHQWVNTGLWPLPCAVCRRTCFFERSDVRRWLASGAWPDGARFRSVRASGRRMRQ